MVYQLPSFLSHFNCSTLHQTTLQWQFGGLAFFFLALETLKYTLEKFEQVFSTATNVKNCSSNAAEYNWKSVIAFGCHGHDAFCSILQGKIELDLALQDPCLRHNLALLMPIHPCFFGHEKQ